MAPAIRFRSSGCGGHQAGIFETLLPYTWEHERRGRQELARPGDTAYLICNQSNEHELTALEVIGGEEEKAEPEKGPDPPAGLQGAVSETEETTVESRAGSAG